MSEKRERICPVCGRSYMEVGSKASTGAKIYPVCSPVLRCSGVTFMTEGGENHAEDNHIGRD